ncbi:MAG: hypothetical protein GY717_05700 [Rhodobacteraceae bacterium]|nr:hypothetical protein [Paracoccaceae bacterium]
MRWLLPAAFGKCENAVEHVDHVTGGDILDGAIGKPARRRQFAGRLIVLAGAGAITGGQRLPFGQPGALDLCGLDFGLGLVVGVQCLAYLSDGLAIDTAHQPGKPFRHPFDPIVPASVVEDAHTRIPFSFLLDSGRRNGLC